MQDCDYGKVYISSQFCSLNSVAPPFLAVFLTGMQVNWLAEGRECSKHKAYQPSSLKGDTLQHI